VGLFLFFNEVKMRTPAILIAAAAAVAFAVPASAGEIRPFDAKLFGTVQAQNSSVIVFVHASWCPICKAQEQTIRKLLVTPRFKNVTVMKIDFDTQKALWRKFGVTQQSTLIGFHGQRETARLSHDADPDKVASVIASTLR
jgi:thioredoxin 1